MWIGRQSSPQVGEVIRRYAHAARIGHRSEAPLSLLVQRLWQRGGGRWERSCGL